MAETATPSAPVGPSPIPQAAEIGQKAPKSKNLAIDQASQQSLAEKIVRGAAAEPAEAKDEPAQAKPTADKLPPAPAANDDQEKPAGPQKYKVKIDGKEQEVPLDELTRNYQLRAVSDKRLKEATELEKKIQSVLQVIQSDTGAALKAAGLTDEQVDSFAIQLIAKRQQAFLEQEKLKAATPDEQELHRLRKLEADYKRQQEQQAQQTRQWHVQQVKTAMTNLVISTLEHLPKEYRKNDFVASRALDAWQYAYENQQELRDKGIALTPESVAQSLRKEVEGLGKTLAELAKEAVAANEPIPDLPAQPGKPISRKQETKKPEKSGLTQAQLIRQITLGER